MNTNFQETKLLQLKKRIKQSSEMSINKSVNKQSSGTINDNGGSIIELKNLYFLRISD